MAGVTVLDTPGRHTETEGLLDGIGICLRSLMCSLLSRLIPAFIPGDDWLG